MAETSQYRPSDFNNMKYRINTIPPREYVIDYFPDLRSYPILTENDVIEYTDHNEDGDEWASERMIRLSRDQVLRYVLYAYDNGSPITRIEDAYKRKSLAAIQAGYPKGSREHDLLIKGLITDVNQIISLVFFLQNNRDLELLISGREAFAMLMEKVREPVNESKLTDDKATRAYTIKKECFDKADELNKSLIILEEKLFKNNPEQQDKVENIKAGSNLSLIEKMALNITT